MGRTKILPAFDALLPALVLTCVHGVGGAHSTAHLSLALTIVCSGTMDLFDWADRRRYRWRRSVMGINLAVDVLSAGSGSALVGPLLRVTADRALLRHCSSFRPSNAPRARHKPYGMESNQTSEPRPIRECLQEVEES